MQQSGIVLGTEPPGTTGSGPPPEQDARAIAIAL